MREINPFLLPNLANLSYEIPSGVADDHFHVDWQRGIVTTRGQFDRESQSRYVLPIYVRDANRMSMSPATAVRKQRSSESNAEQINAQHFDVGTLIISIGDVNDNAPEFRPGACYGLSVPENSDTAIIHTVVASDADEGPNAELVYSIVGESPRANPLQCLLHQSFSLSSFQVAMWATSSA